MSTAFSKYNNGLPKTAKKPSLNKFTQISFNTKPGLNFIFGRQILSSTPKPSLPKQFVPESPKERTVKIDLSKYLNKTANDDELKNKELMNIQEESRKFVEVNVGTDSEDSEYDEEDLQLIKKQLNEKAEQQKIPPSLKATEETDIESTLKQKESNIDLIKLNEDLEKYKQTNELLKSEINLIKANHLSEMKKNIEKKEAYIEIIKNLLNKCADELNNNKTILKTIIDLIKDAAAITNNPSLKDSERLIKYQFITNYETQIISRINLNKIDELIKSIMKKEGNTINKYKEQIERIKAENQLLSTQTDELEKAMGTINMIQTAPCWGSEDYINVRKERDLYKTKLNKLNEKHNRNNITRLAQILTSMYNHKGNKQNIISNEDIISNINSKEDTIKSLNKEIDELKKSLERSQIKIDNLTECIYKKDINFANQMTEIKKIFNEIRNEKEAKQIEILNYLKQIKENKQVIADLKEELIKVQSKPISEAKLYLYESDQDIVRIEN